MMHSKNLQSFSAYFPEFDTTAPWEIVSELQSVINTKIKTLDVDYKVHGSVAIHKNAIVEEGVIMKGSVIIGPQCFIGAHAYLRGGVFLGASVSIGPGCELKTTIVLDHSALAHFNFAGDSIIGSKVNMEAGSIIANHHNDREDKTIWMLIGNEKIKLPVIKFGAYISDEVKIGANAVCSPGTYLQRAAIVRRLELVQQIM